MTRNDNGLRALAASVADVLSPLLARRDTMEVRLMADWPAIVGTATAVLCRPAKLAFPPRRRQAAILHVTVMSRAASLELQYAAPQILSRINSHFGFQVVASLRLIQPSGNPMPPPPAGRAHAPIDSPGGRHVPPPAALALIEDADLRAALAGIGGLATTDRPHDTPEAAAGNPAAPLAPS